MAGGRPLKYETAELLQADVDKYFEMCEEKGKPYTMTGLAIALDVDRSTLTYYAKREEFFNTVKKARNKVENFLEERLFENNVAGVIFNLKNNFGWTDKQEIEMSGHMSLASKTDAELDAEIESLKNGIDE